MVSKYLCCSCFILFYLYVLHSGHPQSSSFLAVGGGGCWQLPPIFNETTPGCYNFTVPVGVTSIRIEAAGAAGSGSMPGLGGKISANFVVTPGEILQVNVGGSTGNDEYSYLGGFNGGGTCQCTQPLGGGGASDVRLSSSLSDRIIVAGGGGGTGSCYGPSKGGDGGGLTGQDAPHACDYSNTEGRGGTETAGGAYGCYYPGMFGGCGTTGVLGVGGDGYCGGGGGGGYYGGKQAPFYLTVCQTPVCFSYSCNMHVQVEAVIEREAVEALATP